MKKNKEKEKDPNKTSFIEVFKYLYKTYPGMKSLIMLILYMILFGMIIGVVATNQNSSTSEDTDSTTTEITSITYKEMLDNLVSKDSNIKYNITLGDITYYLEVKYENNILTGTYEDSLGNIHKFKISDDNIYELSMSNENLNNELLGNININYIIPSHLVDILENNKAIKNKENDDMIYTYDIDGINYKISANTNIYKIEITDDINTYIIEFE